MAVAVGNSATARGLYEAFGRGDIAAVLDGMADDVVWDDWTVGNSAQAAGVPWVERREGKAEIAAFFEMMVAALDFHAFEPVGFLEGDGKVAALIRVDVTVRSTGKRIQDEEIHLITFDDRAKVTALRHYLDTAKHIAALDA